MGVSGPCGRACPWVGVKGQRASTLEPKWLPIHWEAQHLQRGLERSIGNVSLLPNNAITGRDVLASWHDIPAACSVPTPASLINDLQVEDDASSLDLPGFDSTVEDADSLGEGGDVQAGREAAWVREGVCHGIKAGKRAPGHAVAAVNVFLQLVGGCKRTEFWGRCKR